MEKASSREVSTCPDLFDGLEGFLDDIWQSLRRAGLISLSAALPAGMALAWWLNRQI